MLDRRTFVKLASTLSLLAGAPAAFAARLRTRTIKGNVVTVDSGRKKFDLQEGDYDDYGDTYVITVNRKTRIRVKEGDKSPRRGKFSDIEEDREAKVKGRGRSGAMALTALDVLVYIPDYDDY